MEVTTPLHERARWLSVAAALALSALATRAVHLVATRPPSAQHHPRAARSTTERGRVLAADGAVLAESVTGREVDVAPAELMRAPWAIDRLAALLGYNDAATLQSEVMRAAERGTRVLRLRRNVDEPVAARIRTERGELPGVWITEVPRRRYPQGDLMALPVGFMGDVEARDLAEPVGYRRGDRVGRAGVERSWELTLRGVSSYAPDHRGMTLSTTIDTAMQSAAARALGSSPGAVVALDPRDGRVLAYVSRPAVDPMRFEGEVIEDSSAPSLWLAWSMLDRVSGETRRWTSWAALMTLFDDLSRSISSGCRQDAPRVDAPGTERLIRDLGFGHMTGVDLRDEADGEVRIARTLASDGAPDERAAPVYPELIATPLQVAVAFAAITNGGVLYQPRVVDQVRSPDGAVVHRATPVVRARVTIPSCARARALAAMARDERADVSLAEVGALRDPHRSFVALAPALAPELVVVATAGDGGVSPFDDPESAALAVVRAWNQRHSARGARP